MGGGGGGKKLWAVLGKEGEKMKYGCSWEGEEGTQKKCSCVRGLGRKGREDVEEEGPLLFLLLPRVVAKKGPPRFIKTKGACSLSLYLSVVFALERNGGRKEESRKRLKFGVFAAKTSWLSEQKKGFFFTREALVSWSDLFHAQQRPQEEEDTGRAKMGRIRDIVKGGPLLNELRIATVQLACDMCQRQIPLVFLKKKKERKNNLSPSRSMIHLTSAQEEKCEKKQIRDK